MLIDILRTYSSTNSTQSHIHVTHIYMYMYELIILNVIKLYCCDGIEFYIYCIVTCHYYGVVFLYSFNQFAFILETIEVFYFPLLYTQCLIAYVCVCVCVCAEEIKVLLLCSELLAVPSISKKCLEVLDAFRHSGVLCWLQN
jgi:hypothetical protein